MRKQGKEIKKEFDILAKDFYKDAKKIYKGSSGTQKIVETIKMLIMPLYVFGLILEDKVDKK